MQVESMDLLTKKEHYQAVAQQAKRVSILITTIQTTKSESILRPEIELELLDNGFSNVVDYFKNNLQPLMNTELEKVLKEEEKKLQNLKNNKD